MIKKYKVKLIIEKEIEVSVTLKNNELFILDGKYMKENLYRASKKAENEAIRKYGNATAYYVREEK